MKKILCIVISTLLLICTFALLNQEVFAAVKSHTKGTEYNINSIGDRNKVGTNGDIVCTEEGTTFQPGTFKKDGDFFKLNEEDLAKSKSMLAYIFATTEGATVESGSAVPVTQEAAWAVFNKDRILKEKYTDGTRHFRKVTSNSWSGGDLSRTGTPKFVTLYREAEEYAEFINGIKKLSKVTENQNIKDSNNNKIVGPYKIEFNEKFVTIKSIKIEDTSQSISTNSKDKIWVSDENGNPKAIKSNEDFYITIDTSDANAITNFSGKKIKITGNYTKYELTSAIKLVNKDYEEKQKLGYFETQESEVAESILLKLPNIIPPIQIQFKKVDSQGNPLQGVEFILSHKNGGKYEVIERATSNNEGIVKFDAYTPDSLEIQEFQLSEHRLPGWYLVHEGKTYLKKDWGCGELNHGKYDWCQNLVKLFFSYNGNGMWKKTKTTSTCTDILSIFLYKNKFENHSGIEKLMICKTDSENGENLNGTKFDITLENIATVYKYSNTEIKDNKMILTGTTEDLGKLELEKLIIEDPTKDIKITIEETEAPVGYKKLDGKIVLTLKRNEPIVNGAIDAHNVTLELVNVEKIGNITDEEFNVEEFKKNWNPKAHEINLNIKNIPVMNIGGVVWKDVGTDGKITTSGDEKYQESEGLGGVKVYLVKGEPKFNENNKLNKNETTVVKETTSATTAKEVTGYKNEKGEQYKLKIGEYLFTDVPKADDYCVVFEYDGMNYQTVKVGTENNESKAVETNREEFNKKYQTINSESELEYNEENGKSKLITTDEQENVLDAFRMSAKADKSNIEKDNTWTTKGEINTNSKSLHVNCGLKQRYFDLALGLDVSTATVSINGKSTDYTYEQILKLNEENNQEGNSLILDQKGELLHSKDNENVNYNLYLYESDYNYRIADYDNGIENKVNEMDNMLITESEESELQVYVTYRVVIYNQSAANGHATKLINKYNNEQYNLIKGYCKDGEVSIDGQIITIPEPLNKNQRTQVIYLVYEVNKNEEGNLATGKLDNQVEIYEYDSEEGIVDYDSAPNNNKEKEDDLDKAVSLNVQVTDNTRTISGIVFEDNGKDGKKEGDTPVNDVIVQLIEIKEIDLGELLGENAKIYCEYIWQETRSGKNQVKTTARNGYAGQEYTNSVTENGAYEFKDFIPGNYIIRFIYGDGTTYDITPNVQQYNGQDYKSTYMKGETEGTPNYQREWYNNTQYAGNTKAIDNEARRLEVMQYGQTASDLKDMVVLNEVSPNKNKLKDVLDKTWMCAETAKIDVSIKDNNTFTDVDFGLMQRPKAQVSLEKHLIGLKVIDGTNAPVMIVSVGEDGKIMGTTGPLKLPVGYATRTDRGAWMAEFEKEDIANAKIEATYEYTVKDESEEDYLVADYVSASDEKIQEIKDALRMGEYNKRGSALTEFYYNGNTPANGKRVTTIVKEIQETTKYNSIVSYGIDGVDASTTGNTSSYLIIDKDGNEAPQTGGTKITFKKDGGLQIGTNDTSVGTVVLTYKMPGTIDNKDVGQYNSYIAEITDYSNAAGRRYTSIPGNLKYSQIETGSLENHETDEFWGESIKITVDTGEDRQSPIQIAIIAVAGIAIIGVGIVLIKKYVITK